MQVRRVLPPEAIESIDDPTFSEGYGGDAADDALVLDDGNGPARAYPLLVLNYHEIVNDVVDGAPVAVTWCPLCGSAVVYDRVVDGRTLTFGVSGKLAEDDLVMYDRETESEWKQSMGECFSGPLEGRPLSVRPASVMSMGRFEDAYPDGVILDRPEGEHGVVVPAEDGGVTTESRDIDYTADHFAAYVESDWVGSRSREESRSWTREDLAAKEVVLGIEVGDEAVAVPRSRLESEDPVRLSVGGSDLVVFRADEDLHAFEDPGFPFEARSDGEYIGDGKVWQGTTGRAEDGHALERVPARRMFAFAWQADHGPEAFALPD